MNNFQSSLLSFRRLMNISLLVIGVGILIPCTGFAQQIAERNLDDISSNPNFVGIHSISASGPLSVRRETSPTTGLENVIAEVRDGSSVGSCIFEENPPETFSLSQSDDFAATSFRSIGLNNHSLIMSAQNIRVYRAENENFIVTLMLYYLTDSISISRIVIGCDPVGNRLINFNIFYINDGD